MVYIKGGDSKVNKLTTGLVTTISKIMPKPKPVNIYYHDITKGSGQSYMQIELNKFYEQMRCIDENNYETTLFSDLNKNCFNKRKSVLITFDDGFSSNYYYAFEILKRFNIKANIFLTLDFIGTENYLSWEMIKDMNDSGLVEFGAHTKSHTDARHIDCNNFKSEIVEVNEKVQQNCGYKVEDFCFPYGIYDKRTLDFFKDLGIYKRLYTSD